MNKELHDFVIFTDKKLDECESPYPFIDKVQNEWTMWLDANDFKFSTTSDISLVPVISDSDYKALFEIRKIIEVAFGNGDDDTVQSLINDIRQMAEKHKGVWYLAKHENIFVGTIGIVPFEFKGQQVGRLKDVQIISQAQGKGLGGKMLRAVCDKAHKMNLQALCLTADADNWPKDWYLNFGFQKVGEVKV